MIPTKFIDKDKFTELVNLEGDVLPVFKLVNIPFDPPLPNGDHIHTRVVEVPVMLMNVTEPVIYKDKNMAIVIMNGYDNEKTMTYESFRDCHVVKDPVNAWGYYLAPSYWDLSDEDDDMDDPVFVFRHEEYQGQGLDDVKEAA